MRRLLLFIVVFSSSKSDEEEVSQRRERERKRTMHEMSFSSRMQKAPIWRFDPQWIAHKNGPLKPSGRMVSTLELKLTVTTITEANSLAEITYCRSIPKRSSVSLTCSLTCPSARLSVRHASLDTEPAKNAHSLLPLAHYLVPARTSTANSIVNVPLYHFMYIIHPALEAARKNTNFVLQSDHSNPSRKHPQLFPMKHSRIRWETDKQTILSNFTVHTRKEHQNWPFDWSFTRLKSVKEEEEKWRKHSKCNWTLFNCHFTNWPMIRNIHF